MHTYIHTCIHAYTHMHTHIYIHTHTRIHTYIHTYIHIYINAYTHIHRCMHACMHADNKINQPSKQTLTSKPNHGVQRLARSDHEPILASGFHVPPGKKQKSVSQWGSRELRLDCADLLRSHSHHQAAHAAIAAMAKDITQAVSRRKFKESRALKDLRRQAHTAPPGAEARILWKQVAAQQNGNARSGKPSWPPRLGNTTGTPIARIRRPLKGSKSDWSATLLDDPSWKERLTTHMTNIFAKASPRETSEAMTATRSQATDL